MPTPAIKHDDTRDPKNDLCWCSDCGGWFWRGLGHDCPLETRMQWRSIRVAVALVVIAALMIAGLLKVHSAYAREGRTPKPILRPAGLLQAKRECSRSTPLVECRAALRRALAAVEWQRHERLHQGAFGVQHALRLASALYGVPLSELDSQANCESHKNPRAKNRHSTASGLFQFLDSTWARAGVPGFSPFDPYASALAAARLVVKDGGWREWSCKP